MKHLGFRWPTGATVTTRLLAHGIAAPRGAIELSHRGAHHGKYGRIVVTLPRKPRAPRH
jgi:hypothetical protein